MMHKPDSQNRTTAVLMNPSIPFKRNYWLQLMIVIFAVFWIVLAIRPTDRTQWFIENLLLIGAVLTLIFTYKRFRFTNLSYLLMFIFLCLHTYAAHFTYQNTPFDVWLKAVFHTHRSYFDRVVHFAFGLLWTYPFREVFVLVSTQRRFWSYAIPAAVVFSFSALFEIIEMVFASLAGGQAGQDYLGLQGDVFDTQKDMGLGLIGAVCSVSLVAIMKWKKEKQASRGRKE